MPPLCSTQGYVVGRPGGAARGLDCLTGTSLQQEANDGVNHRLGRIRERRVVQGRMIVDVAQNVRNVYPYNQGRAVVPRVVPRGYYGQLRVL